MASSRKPRKFVTWQVDPLTGCWNSVGYKKTTSGYPVIARGVVRTSLHRYIYEVLFGILPREICVRHKCDNRMCINPEHLEPGTLAENNHDMVTRGRAQRGVAHHKARLTEDQVYEIRESQSSLHSLARRFKVSRTTIQNIRKRKIWKYLPEKGEEN